MLDIGKLKIKELYIKGFVAVLIFLAAVEVAVKIARFGNGNNAFFVFLTAVIYGAVGFLLTRTYMSKKTRLFSLFAASYVTISFFATIIGLLFAPEISQTGLTYSMIYFLAVFFDTLFLVFYITLLFIINLLPSTSSTVYNLKIAALSTMTLSLALISIFSVDISSPLSSLVAFMFLASVILTLIALVIALTENERTRHTGQIEVLTPELFAAGVLTSLASHNRVYYVADSSKFFNGILGFTTEFIKRAKVQGVDASSLTSKDAIRQAFVTVIQKELAQINGAGFVIKSYDFQAVWGQIPARREMFFDLTNALTKYTG